MHVLLFGGTGFVGEYLQKNLNDKKNYKIAVVGRSSKLDYNPEVIVVLTQPGILSEVLLPKLYRFKKLKKILYLSTTLLYPDSKYRQDEDVSPDPKTEYEKKKYKEELLLSMESQKRGFYLCIARLSNVYGDVKNKGIINHIMKTVLKGTPFVIQGNKNKKIRDYVFVEDAVNLLEFLISFKQKKDKEIFNICLGYGSSIQDLIDSVESITLKKVNLEIGKKVFEKQTNIGENKKILHAADYKLRYSLIDGLKKTYTNYLEFYS